jgi:hypothetical protein
VLILAWTNKAKIENKNADAQENRTLSAFLGYSFLSATIAFSTINL